MELKTTVNRYEHNKHHWEHLAEKLGAKMSFEESDGHVKVYITGPHENIQQLKQKLAIFGVR